LKPESKAKFLKEARRSTREDGASSLFAISGVVGHASTDSRDV